MGFDYAPGDMIAALTAEGIGPLEEITLAYSVRNLRMTRGTTLSGIGMLTASELEYIDGRLRPGDRSVSRGSFRFPPPRRRPADGPLPIGRADHRAPPRRGADGEDDADGGDDGSAADGPGAAGAAAGDQRGDEDAC